MSAILKPEIQPDTRVNITVADRTWFGLTVVARSGEQAKVLDALGRAFLVFIDDCTAEPSDERAEVGEIAA